MKTILFAAALQEEIEVLWKDPSFKWSAPKYQGDSIWYREAKHNQFRIIAAATCEMGLVASGIVATKLILRWQPEIVIDLGLCAGRPGTFTIQAGGTSRKISLRLGDIAVSTACYLYGAGFYKDGKLQQFDSKCLRNKSANNVVKAAVASWQSNYNPGEFLNEDCPQIVEGEYAVADYLMKNEDVMEDLSKANSNFLALEMESYAVAKAASILGVPYGAVIVKAVSDNGTQQKNDDKRDFVKRTSMLFAVNLANEFIRATQRKKSGWPADSLPGLVLPRKKVLVLSSATQTFNLLSKALKTSAFQLPGGLPSLPPVHVNSGKAFILTETSTKRPCSQAEFAIWSSLFMTKCKPKIVLVVGLCPGIAKKNKKGEVVESCRGDLILVNRAYHHQFGAIAKGKSLEREIRSVDLIDSLNGFLHSIHGENISGWLADFHKEFSKEHPRARKPKITPKCHIAPTASSDYFLSDEHLREHISGFDRKVKGVDIEAHAVMRTAKHCGITLGALIVRGISRHLNPKDGENYELFSRALSVNVAVQLLNSGDLKKIM